MKLQINAGDKDATNAQDVAIANVHGNKFIIPLNVEMLDSTIPYYQSGPGNKLCYEITITIKSSYQKTRRQVRNFGHILRIRDCYPPRRVSDEKQNMALPYDRILRHNRTKVCQKIVYV